jgi:hypothetical protein
VIVGASLAVHVSIAVWAWLHDVEQPHALAYREGIDVSLPDYVDRVDPTIAMPAPGVAQPALPPRPIVPARTPSRAAASDPVELAREASRMATILTGDDGERGFGAMSPRQPGSDLATQIASARATHATIGDGSHTSRADDRAQIGVGSNAIATSDPTYTATAHVEERPTRVQLQPHEAHGDPFDPNILRKIQSVYMAGLQRCYQLALRDDAALAGKVALELTIEANGRVSEPSATGVSAAVDRCIEHQMASWRFQAPRDEATFQISLVLSPGR